MSERALATQTEPEVPVATMSAVSVAAMIERVALNPALDLDRMERLLGFYERIKATEAKVAYADALAAMQPELPTIDARGRIEHNGKLISQYAKWEDVNDVIKPVLAKHRFALDFGVSQDDKGLSVTATLSHGGHTKETTLRLPLDTSGAKNAVQAIGSTVSYGKRYTAGLLLNLTSRGEDDDGKAAGNGGPIGTDQIARLYNLIDEVKADVPKFCKYMKVQKIEDITAANFKRAVAALEAKRAKS